MKYSIVMPCYYKDQAHKQVVMDTIESVKSSSQDHELIIVDDGSTLPTGWLKKEADTYVRHNPTNKGIAPSWNDGKNVSRGKYVVIINDDIRVPEDWLDMMYKTMELCRDAGVIGVKYAGPGVEPQLKIGEVAPKDHKWFSGYCFMLKRDRFFEDFDEQFIPFNFEDIDYWERIQQAGLGLYKAPIAIWHAEGNTIHSMKYEETDNINLKKFIDKWGFNPKEKYFG